MFERTTRGGHRGRSHHPHHHRDDAPWRGPEGPADAMRGRGVRHVGLHGPDGPRGPRGGRLQARRGAIRNAMLALLAEEPMHGYQLMQGIAQRSGDRWRPSAGSIYPTLQQLEDEGLVVAEERDGRRTFALTEAGRAAAAAIPAERPWAHREGGDDLRGLARELGLAAMQVARIGSPDAVAAARTVLTDARRNLYRILADDGTADDGTADDGAADAPTDAPTA